MRRIIAYVIDYIILTIIIRITTHYSLMVISNITFISFINLFFMYIFFLLNDVAFKGYSIGKKIVGMKIILKDTNIWRFSIIHSLYKIGFTLISMIALLIYLVNNRKMIYDNRFYYECM